MEGLIDALIFAEELSAPGFRAAINNCFQRECNDYIRQFFDTLDVQWMACKMIDKVLQERAIWQSLVNECCYLRGKTFGLDLDEVTAAEEQPPVKFVLRCMRSFRELVNSPQHENGQRR